MKCRWSSNALPEASNRVQAVVKLGGFQNGAREAMRPHQAPRTAAAVRSSASAALGRAGDERRPPGMQGRGRWPATSSSPEL
jgi:hypothetical protein